MEVETGTEMVSPHIPEDNWLDPWLMQVCVKQVEGRQTSSTGMLPGHPLLLGESYFSKAEMLIPCLKAQARGHFGSACKDQVSV